MYVKKSSTRSSRVERGQIDSALRTALDEKETSVSATLFGEVGEDMLPGPDGDSRRLLLLASLFALIASACRLGGPRRLLGRLKVHGISRAAQARHGIPDSSHCLRRPRQHSSDKCDENILYLYFSDAAGIASFPQTIALLCIPSAGGSWRKWWGNRLLRVTISMSVCMAIAVCQWRLELLRGGLRIVWVCVCLRRGREAVMG
jgi:hypothetical protein